jgi:ubiquinone/menaquinone biosynthesis C-methylase UbiE
MAVFKRSRLACYANCLRLFDAYTEVAPLWERTLLAAYVGIGPPLARLFGGNTATVWQQAESIIEDLFNVSQMSPRKVVAALRTYMKLKKQTDYQMSFAEARRQIYDQDFYPLVTHFTFAFQSSAVARLRFVKRLAAQMTFANAVVADLGCGSGTMLCEVLGARTNWIGYGLDIGESSVRYARRLAAHKGVADRAFFQQGNITELPFADGSLDLVIASEVIEHLPNPAVAFQEISRVLAPGGFLALTVPLESRSPAHLNSLVCLQDFHALCQQAGLNVQSLSAKWHLTFGDDPRHLFAVARSEVRKERPATSQRNFCLSFEGTKG